MSDTEWDTEATVEPLLCTACDHPVESHHPLLGCQQQLPGGLLVATHTCPCALAPQVRSALLEVAMDRTEAILADYDDDPVAAEAAPVPVADVAMAGLVLGMIAASLQTQGYRPEPNGPFQLELSLPGGRVATVHCHVEPSREPF